jgi:hypothetical protein
MPTSKNTQTKSPTSKAKSEIDGYMSDEEVINLIDRIAQDTGIVIDLESIGLNISPENTE